MPHICKEKKKSYLAFYGGCVEMLTPLESKAQSGGGPRDDVYGFSQESRLRLMKLLSRARNIPRYFCTLTYPATFPTMEQSKTDARKLIDYMLSLHKKEKQKALYIWRLEKQERGAPHFHFLVWLDGKLDREKLQKEIRRLRPVEYEVFTHHRKGWVTGKDKSKDEWAIMLCLLSIKWNHIVYGNRNQWPQSRIHHLNNSVDLRDDLNERKVISYVSKYIAKREATSAEDMQKDLHANEHTGRIWGKKGDDSAANFDPIEILALPVAEGDALAAHILAEIGTQYAISLAEAQRGTWSVFAPRERVQAILDGVMDNVSRETITDSKANPLPIDSLFTLL